MEAKKCNHLYFPLVIFTIAAIPVLALQSGSGSGEALCNGDIQQLRNCTESELVERFYFNTSAQQCVNYTTCPSDSPLPNVFDSMDSCNQSCGENITENAGCPDLLPIENGLSTKACQNDYCYAVFACDSKYKLVGSSHLTCEMDNGQWSGTMPSCVATSVSFEGTEVLNGGTVNSPEGTNNLQFECKIDPPNLPGHFKVTQQWILEPELDTQQYFSDEKSAYILEVAEAKYTKVTCKVNVTTEAHRKSVTWQLATEFSIKVLTEAEAPSSTYPPYSNVRDDEIMLICTFEGKPKPDVSWYLDGNLVDSNLPNIAIIDLTKKNPSLTYSSLTIENPTESNYGQYTCTATNVVGKASEQVFVSAPGSSPRSVRSIPPSHDLCSSALQEQTAMFKGRLTRKLSLSGDQDIYHLKIDEVFHSINFPSSKTGSVLRVAAGLKELPLDTRRHQPAIFIVRTENERIVLDSYWPYSNETEKEIKQRCFK